MVEINRDSSAPPVPWKTSDLVIGVFMVLVGTILALAGFVAAGGDSDSKAGIVVIGGSVGAILAFAAWSMGPAKYGVSLGSLGLKISTRMRSSQLFLPFLALAASLTFTAIYTGVISLTGWDILPPEQLPEEVTLNGPWIVVSFLLVVLWGPLAEEIFFRGFIFSGLRARIGPGRAILLSALIFTLFHVDPRVMVPIFVTGALLAWLYHRSGHIWSPFLAHASQNGIAFALSVWVLD